MSDILRDLVEPAELVAISVGGESVQFKVEKGLSIGRRRLFGRRNQAEIALEYPFLAHTQGKLTHYLGEWHYENLTNANTTSINGVALPKGEDRLLQNGDIIRSFYKTVTEKVVDGRSAAKIEGKVSVEDVVYPAGSERAGEIIGYGNTPEPFPIYAPDSGRLYVITR